MITRKKVLRAQLARLQEENETLKQLYRAWKTEAQRWQKAARERERERTDSQP